MGGLYARPLICEKEAVPVNDIERMFADALCKECCVSSLEDMQSEEEHGISLCKAQKPIGIYIVDFYIEDMDGNKYVVEIDGHEAHKTKIQRYEDYVRERFLQKQLIVVIRFTASEVFVDADKCARECADIIDMFAGRADYMRFKVFEAGRKFERTSARGKQEESVNAKS